MGALEKVGMLKMDMLGLKTLTVIHDAVHDDRATRHGVALDMDALPFDDPAVYAAAARRAAPPASSSSSRRSPPTRCAP